jgi:hypothetical protein
MKRRLVSLAGVVLAVAGLVIGAVSAIGASSNASFDRQALAQQVLKSPISHYLTWPAQAALNMDASGTRALGPSASAAANGDTAPTAASTLHAAGPVLTNVRVNNPAEDVQLDQTTQSEPMVTASGSNVVVGFNDSQNTLLFLTAASTLSGYAYSTDGGATFTDGGPLPNAPGFMNLGDPWVAHNRAGNVYYSNLAIDGTTGNLDVAVAKSSDGGKTWSTAPVYAPSGNVLYQADKDALTIGRDPANASQDDLYDAWDDFAIHPSDTGFAATLGLAVAHSTDGGDTWSLSYAAQNVESLTGCSFTQYIGADPFVDPSTGTLYVTAERLSAEDPNCVGVPPSRSEVIFRSTDGGRTFSKGVTIASVTPAFATGALSLGPGMLMRDLEFPTAAIFGGKLYVAWNDGSGGHSHIVLASSSDGGATWSTTAVTNDSSDELQPAMSADTALHILYYKTNSNRTLDVFVSDSSDGTSFTTQKVTTQSSPGVFTAPQFDPIIAPAYMGDYIGNVSDGAHQYFVWGDNRDTVTNMLWPHGRHDPNVYFAKR